MNALIKFLQLVGLLKKHAPEVAHRLALDLERENRRLDTMSDAIMKSIERTTLEVFSE